MELTAYRPVVALVAGVIEPPGRIMGHAGAFTIAGEPDAKAKITALETAGATIIDHPAKFGDALRARLEGKTILGTPTPRSATLNRGLGAAHRRQFHTAFRRARQREQPLPAFGQQQRRNIYLTEAQCMDLLRETGINCGTSKEI